MKPCRSKRLSPLRFVAQKYAQHDNDDGDNSGNDKINDLKEKLAATLRWFTAGGAIRIAVRQLSQTWKLRHYDVIDDVITRKL